MSVYLYTDMPVHLYRQTFIAIVFCIVYLCRSPKILLIEYSVILLTLFLSTATHKIKSSVQICCCLFRVLIVSLICALNRMKFAPWSMVVCSYLYFQINHSQTVALSNEILEPIHYILFNKVLVAGLISK